MTEVMATAELETERAKGSLPRVLGFTEAVRDAWDQYVREEPGGTFFHLTAWKRVIESVYGYRPFYFYAETEGRITGVLPVFLVANWVTGRSLLSLPFAVYGGICTSDPKSEVALRSKLGDVGRELGVDFIELRTPSGEVAPGYCPVDRYSTFQIPLIRDAGAMYSSFPKDIRYMIRKAEKAGLHCIRGHEQLRVFYDLLSENLKRLGTPAFPMTLLSALIQEYRENTDITIVYQGVRPLAGALTFCFKDTVQPYYIGSTEEAKRVAANNFLWWKLIEFGCEQGYRVFDFGRSKNGSGNFDFKKKWNPSIESLKYQVLLIKATTIPNNSPTNPRFQMATNIWKKLPLSLTKKLGPQIVKWFP